MTDQTSAQTRAQKFGQYVAVAARAAGYDIDSPRGGGKKALAEAAGMSHASVSRMLAGQTIPDPSFFEPLARALHLPVSEMLIQSGVVSAESLMRPEILDHPLSAREVAAQLGITSADKIAAFESMVRVLTEDDHTESRRTA